MIYEATDTKNVGALFDGWEETLIYSCLQQVMGKIYVDDLCRPGSACALIGDFAFYAGKPDSELVRKRWKDFVIMVPQNGAWSELIERHYPKCSGPVTRYATKKDTVFDRRRLETLVKSLEKGYELQRIDGEIYDRCLKESWSKDLVGNFAGREDYLRNGLGMVVTCCGEVVSGASSYTRYREGIEIEVDTRKDMRRKHLATACCAALILECLERGLYASWDAQNMNSLRLAEKLGYEFSHEYAAYEVVSIMGSE